MILDLEFIEKLNGFIIADEPLRTYRKLKIELINNDDPIGITDYMNAVTAYLDWYILYCDDILRHKIVKDEHIVPHIFRPKITSEHQFKEFLKKSIYISREYVVYLKSKITPDNILRYKHTLTSIDSDLEWLMVNYEVAIRKTAKSIIMTSGRRPYLTPTDIYSAARELFFIEEVSDIENLYLRDLKPVVMFQIRQIIEVYGKELLGYVSITDDKDETIKKFTQIAWEFIQIECNKKEKSRIILPFDINLILPIYKWSNSFVHRTYIYSSYVQFYALKVLRVLFKGSGVAIPTYDGGSHRKTLISDIKITAYKSLKQDFENYLISKNSAAHVKWMPEKNVGAYILSL